MPIGNPSPTTCSVTRACCTACSCAEASTSRSTAQLACSVSPASFTPAGRCLTLSQRGRVYTQCVHRARTQPCNVRSLRYNIALAAVSSPRADSIPRADPSPRGLLFLGTQPQPSVVVDHGLTHGACGPIGDVQPAGVFVTHARVRKRHEANLHYMCITACASVCVVLFQLKGGG